MCGEVWQCCGCFCGGYCWCPLRCSLGCVSVYRWLAGHRGSFDKIAPVVALHFQAFVLLLRIEVWNTILQAANIPLRLNGIMTSDKESNAINTMSTENIFIVNNKITPIVGLQSMDIEYGFMYPITARNELVFVGRQRFIKYRANHIEINRDAFDKDYLHIGVGDPTRTLGVTPKQNICYVAAHEIGHFLGINRHFVSSSPGTFMTIANILPPSALLDCDCDNIVSKIRDFVSLERDLIKGLYPALFLTTQHQNDDCIPQSTRTATQVRP